MKLIWLSRGCASRTNGELESVGELLDAGADIQSVDDLGCGWMPIHWAASNARIDMVRLLLEHGADPPFTQRSHGRGIPFFILLPSSLVFPGLLKIYSGLTTGFFRASTTYISKPGGFGALQLVLGVLFKL